MPLHHPRSLGRRGWLAVVLGAVAATVLATSGAGLANAAPATQATTQAHYYPVPYTFAAAIPAALDPNASPPGANDFSCKPSAAHPEPVVLTHGLGGNRNDNWQTFSPLLADEGYCVFALTYGVGPNDVFPLNQVGGRLPMQRSAQQLSDFVDRVLAATGAQKVNILGHSEGTIMPTYYINDLGGKNKVDKDVSLAPLWQGSTVAGLSTLDEYAKVFGFSPVVDGLVNPACTACQQVLAGSDFVNHLQAEGVYSPQVRYTNLVTRYDEAVVPYTSGIRRAPNATNIVVQHQCGLDLSDHLAIAADPVAAADVLNALDPAHPRPVPCTLVLPFVG